MDFRIIFDNLPAYVLIRTEGEASPEGFDRLLTRLVRSAEWVPGTAQLIDHRDLITDHLTSGSMQRIKDIVLKHSKALGHGPCAFVVNDTVNYGVARMYELMGGREIHGELNAFYSLEDAAEWLTGLYSETGS